MGDLSPNAGEASIANLDGIRFADGDIPTSQLRLKVRFQTTYRVTIQVVLNLPLTLKQRFGFSMMAMFCCQLEA